MRNNDIKETSLQKTTDELLETENLYQSLFKQLPDGILILDTDGKFLDFNEAAHRRLGYSREEFERLRISDIDPFETPEETKHRIKKIIENGSAEFEVKHRTKTGEIRNVHVTTQSLTLSGSTICHSIWRDITERKLVETKLKESIKKAEDEASKSEAIIKAIGEGITIRDTNFRILYQNRITTDALGNHVGELCYKAYHGLDQACKGCPVELSLQDGQIHTEEKTVPTDKGVMYLLTTASPVRDAAGKIIAGIEIVRNVTEFKRADEALKETTARLETLIHAIPDMVVFKDVEGRHLVVNKAAEKFIGLRHEELAGKTNEELLPPGLAVLCRKSDEEAMRSPTPVQYEEPVIGKDGKTVFLDTIKARIHDDAGNLKGLLAVSRDITRRRETEENILRISRQKEHILNAAGEGIYGLDHEGRITFINPAGAKMVGWTVEELIGRPSHDLLHHSRRDGIVYPREECPFHKALATGAVHHVKDEVFWRKDGTSFPIEYVSTPITEGGNITGAVVVFRDISGRKQTEEALKEAVLKAKEEKARTEAIVSAIGDSLVVVDPDFRIIYQNQIDRDIMGNVVGEICYKTFEGRETVCEDCPVEISFKDGLVHRSERMAMTKVGAKHLDITASPLRDASGNIIAVVEMVRDITERKRAGEALRISEERLRLALAAANQGLYDLNIQTGEVVVSREYATMLGYDPDDFRETNIRWLERLHPEDREPVAAVYQDYISGKIPTYTVEFRQRTRTGEWKWILSLGKIVQWDAEGKPLRMLGTHTDITERRKLLEQLEDLNRNLTERVREEIEKNRAKEQLMQLQSRHAAMGEMIDNIAHQWRQPLNNLGLIMQGMQKKFNDGSLTAERMQEQAKIGLSLIRYMSQTINDFTNFFRHDKAMARFRIKDVVTTALSFMETNLKRNTVTVVSDIADDITIKGYRNEYTQVLVNILNNARDIFVERDIRKPEITLFAFRENGASVLTIADNGGGISSDLIGRIFAPYFTTKAQNKGTGIGLYMSKMIIENNMNGRLSVRNKGDGAEFRIEVQNGE